MWLVRIKHFLGTSYLCIKDNFPVWGCKHLAHKFKTEEDALRNKIICQNMNNTKSYKFYYSNYPIEIVEDK